MRDVRKTFMMRVNEGSVTKSFKVWIMVGLPGAGKSTWIENNVPRGTKIVSQDRIRERMGIMDSSGRKRIGTSEQEREVSRINNGLVEKYITERTDFVLDNTNLKLGRLTNLTQRLKKLDADYRVLIIDTPLWKCLERRGDDIPKEVMENMNRSIQKVLSFYKENPDEKITIVRQDVNESLSGRLPHNIREVLDLFRKSHGNADPEFAVCDIMWKDKGYFARDVQTDALVSFVGDDERLDYGPELKYDSPDDFKENGWLEVFKGVKVRVHFYIRPMSVKFFLDADEANEWMERVHEPVIDND